MSTATTHPYREQSHPYHSGEVDVWTVRLRDDETGETVETRRVELAWDDYAYGHDGRVPTALDAVAESGLLRLHRVLTLDAAPVRTIQPHAPWRLGVELLPHGGIAVSRAECLSDDPPRRLVQYIRMEGHGADCMVLHAGPWGHPDDCLDESLRDIEEAQAGGVADLEYSDLGWCSSDGYSGERVSLTDETHDLVVGTMLDAMFGLDDEGEEGEV